MTEEDAPLMLALQTIGEMQKEISKLHRELYACEQHLEALRTAE